MRYIEESAPAKINLYLDVLSKRADGYHNILSIMHTVSLADRITVDTAPSGSISVLCNNSAIPSGEKNIAYRAAKLFCDAAGVSPGIEITIEKNIPSPAGLAGGSADAAAVLRALNKIFGGVFDYDALCRMALSIGADVPFCLRGGCAAATGVGEKLRSLSLLPKCFIVIGCGGEGVSTPNAYRTLDDMYGSFADSHAGEGYRSVENALSSGDIAGVCSSLYNIFEAAVLPGHPQASEIKKVMLQSGALGALMSGSGPAVYGIFDDRTRAVNACIRIAEMGHFSHLAEPSESVEL